MEGFILKDMKITSQVEGQKEGFTTHLDRPFFIGEGQKLVIANTNGVLTITGFSPSSEKSRTYLTLEGVK